MTRQQLALAAAVGAVLYAGSKPASAPPARNWDVKTWMSTPAPPQPAANTIPPERMPPRPAPPSTVQPPMTKAPPVATLPLPPVVAPQPIVKETRKRQRRQKTDRQAVDRAPKPAPPQRQATTEPERLPTCAQVCAYVSGKTRQQLQAESAGMTISPRLMSHGMACYVRCRK